MLKSQINWVDGRRPCYWPGLENKGFSFYRRVKHSNVEYEVGSGVYVAGLQPKSRDVARIHCLYENGDTVKPSDRYRAIIEIFLSPKRYDKMAKENNIILHEDIEIIQDGKAKFYNTSVESFLGKCHIVFSMGTENPEKELLKYFKKHSEPTYICRLKLDKIGNTSVFKCVISNEQIKQKMTKNIQETINRQDNLTNRCEKANNEDDDCVIVEEKISKSYKVTSVECNENSVKLKITKFGNVEIKQPSILLDTINIENYKRPLKINSDANDIIDSESKENVSKSRRKQTLTRKTYDSLENIEIENMLNKIENFKIVSPKKRRTRTKSTDSLEINEAPVKKTPKKNSKTLDSNKQSKTMTTPKKTKNSNPESDSEPLKKTPRKNDDLDSIADTMKSRLSIVTPKKTPVRRRLDSFNQENEKTPLRKSTRVSACTKNLSLDINKENEVKATPTRKSLRMSSKNTKKIEELSDDTESEMKIVVKISRKSSVRNTPQKSWRNTKVMTDSESDNEVIENTKNKRKSTTRQNNKTPSRIKVSNLTHDISKRESQIHLSKDTLEKARAQLRNSTLSEKEKKESNCLPCRENEYEDIFNFVEGKLRDKVGGCMYISGVPGTGKTATVTRVIEGLGRKKFGFKTILVNALSLTEPKQVYVEIMKQLTSRSYHWDEALEKLRAFFVKAKHESHILVIDELDKLCTRKQDVVYNLLDLPANSKTPLVVIAIANTMDLPERLLSNKVNSRLGLTRVSFRPYKFSELSEIVKRRLGTNLVSAFKNEAIEFVARKVAAVSGDARRAIAICARATELAKNQNAPVVTMDIINQTLKDTSGSNNVRTIKSLSFIQKIVLRSLAHEVGRTGNDEVSFSQIVRVANEFCTLDGVGAFSSSKLLMAAQFLSAMRLIIAQEGQKDTGGTILLNISADDIHFALKND